MRKKIIALALTGVLASTTLLSACSNTKTEEIKAVASTDKYRNYYEIFVSQFADSDGDGIGDINGITEKLDYLNDGDPNSGDDLGIDGIWLMPIMESDSYHKYDVIDYMSIEDDYGTMEDFEKLTKECDKRGISIIIDLVLNHTSSKNEWFLKAHEDVKKGDIEGEYSQYYSIPGDEGRATGYSYQFFYDTPYSYEANFSGDMPELNLSNKKVREEIANIAKFWYEKGVDGFRLDAVKYFQSTETDGVEFLTWFMDEIDKIDKDLYVVGENWDGNGKIAEYYKSDIDSQFNFSFSNGGGSKILIAVNSKNAKTIFSVTKNWDELINEYNPNSIDSLFLSNHDTVRSGNSFKNNPVNAKMAAAAYMLLPGNSFIYYGEEIGLLSGTDNDATFRIPMVWDNDPKKDGTVLEPPNGVVLEQLKDWQPTKTTVEQQADKNSLMRFYSEIIKLKLQNPEIARGEIVKVIETPTGSVSGGLFKYKDSSLIVMHNLSDEEKVVEVSKDDLDYKGIRGQLTASEPKGKDDDGNYIYSEATLEDTMLTIPAKSTVILK